MGRWSRSRTRVCWSYSASDGHSHLQPTTASHPPCSFYGQLELLLDESVLVGRGRLCQEALRPLAFSMLAELVHHVRSDLTLKQLSRIIYMFSR